MRQPVTSHEVRVTVGAITLEFPPGTPIAAMFEKVGDVALALRRLERPKDSPGKRTK